MKIQYKEQLAENEYNMGKFTDRRTTKSHLFDQKP